MLIVNVVVKMLSSKSSSKNANSKSSSKNANSKSSSKNANSKVVAVKMLIVSEKAKK